MFHGPHSIFLQAVAFGALSFFGPTLDVKTPVGESRASEILLQISCPVHTKDVFRRQVQVQPGPNVSSYVLGSSPSSPPLRLGQLIVDRIKAMETANLI